MTEYSHEQLILDSLAPKVLRQYVDFNNVRNLFLTKKDRQRAFEEIDIHIENVRKNGGYIIGYSSLINSLKASVNKDIYILSGYDDKYGFDLYLDESKTNVLGVSIVKIRIKSEEELIWEKEGLGIRHP
ncbi:MAG: hypothetical protein PW844_05930 [Pantoea sp.]|uniref:hypothetical protein n=1 Tax=Pantoea sp. TaxID=69393 RepID=UPI00239B894E|nr:hypothetical protein [Pantoea sp.]MDE1186005.1 hypothetical protein [Pantoea sp.]